MSGNLFENNTGRLGALQDKMLRNWRSEKLEKLIPREFMMMTSKYRVNNFQLTEKTSAND